MDQVVGECPLAVNGNDTVDADETHNITTQDGAVSPEIQGECCGVTDLSVVDRSLTPKIGMMFDSLKDAFDFYNEYARLVGFSVRIKRTNKHRKDKELTVLQTLCCSCEGTYTKVNTPRKKREETRFKCLAKFETKLNKENKFELSKFISDHTHELVPPSCAYLLKSHRTVEDSQAAIMRKMRSCGLKPSDIYYYFCAEAGGPEYLNFIQSDCSNLLGKERASLLKQGDAHCLLQYFKKRKEENKHFFYSFLTNDNLEIRGIFFCDGLSRRDYALFGDVICFDTTFRTNNYGLVCAPIVGVNNHGQTTIFGCGLLEGETSDAVVWMFNTFLEVMGGKKPGTIFTDQSMAISKAISIVFPEAHHRLCIWHIYQNGLKHLSSVFKKYESFSARFKECIYEPETVEEFDEMWNALLVDYGLENNKWLKGLYELREKWAQVYAHAYFCAGITTTQRSESINKFLKAYFSRKTILREFVDLFFKALSSRHQKANEAENKMRTRAAVLLHTWSVEREASKMYTRKMFNVFQEEYKRTLVLLLKEDEVLGTIQTYKVERLGKWKRCRTVSYDNSDLSARCSCRKFEFEGILCSHILKLFCHLEFTSLPPRYYLKRWTRNVTNEMVYDSYGDSIPNDVDPKATTRYSELSHISQRLVGKGSKSDSLCSLTKSKMLAFEVELDAQIALDEEANTKSLGKKKVVSCDKALQASEDVQLKDPAKKTRGQLKESKIPLK